MLNCDYRSMSEANTFALEMIKNAKTEQIKTENLFTKCKVCYGSAFVIVYENGIRGAKRCPNALWDNEKKEYFCHLNKTTSKQVIDKENYQDLLKAIRKIVFDLKINPMTFPKVVGVFFQVEFLEELSLKQLELLLAKLKLARSFKLDLIYQGRLPQQSTSIKQAISRVA